MLWYGGAREAIYDYDSSIIDTCYDHDNTFDMGAGYRLDVGPMLGHGWGETHLAHSHTNGQNPKD